MLYDLNIAWSPLTSTAELTKTLKFSSSLGYDVVALNHTISLPVPGQITNPLPKWPSGQGGEADAGQDQRLPTVLHRVTVPLTDPAVHHRLPQLAQIYDILALRPSTDKAFQAACLTVADVALISMDLTQQFDFHFRPTPCMTAVKRGVRFEVCYSQFLAADSRGRANFIGNLMSLIRCTKGRGLVISSEAKGAMGLRGPEDVMNLLSVYGLPNEKGKEGLGVNPRGVVVNEGIRRRGFRGVVDIISTAERDQSSRGDEMEGVEVQGVSKTGKVPGNGGQKRKGGTASAQRQDDSAAGQSKRHAKKLKKLTVAEGS
ncbi:RNase P subunit p30 [Xylariales sp. PMI_506]|nr:RNase P subunit p30 [Xylariales sp. PMI_506]